MKKLLLSGTAIVLLVLAGCSGSSPSAGPVPTPPSQTWAITSLTTSSSQPQVLEEVLISAVVTKDGAAVADGTTVTFEITNAGTCQDASGNTVPCAWFTSNGTATASVAASGGRANVYMTAATQGTFTVVARAGNASKSLNVFFRQPDQTTDLHIYSVVPTQGSLAGGEEVILTGKGVYTPVEVYLVVAGNSYQAQVLSVFQGAEEGSIRIQTPAITGVDTSHEYQADIRVVRGVGTSYEQSEVLSGAFRLTPTSGEPEIYSLYPDHGSARGGEQVTILGRNFEAPVQVTFGTSVGTLEANEVTVSADHTQITLTTPQVSADVLQQDIVASVTVVTHPGAGSPLEKSTTKQDAFVFVADQPQPDITAVSPNSGPIEGGTRVTIFGSGFVSPVQVFFDGATIGSREADIVSVNFNEIIVVSPDITATQPTPPVTVDVRVRNVTSGLEGTLEGAFTYGESMFISGNTPTEGGEGTVVTIFGGGFRDPLLVDWGNTRVETISVSGSEVLVRMPALVPVPCDNTTNTFTVTHPDSNLSAEGGSFTYIGNRPGVTSVDPFTVTETSGGDAVSPSMVTIHGVNFSQQLTVSIQQGGNTYVVPASDVTVVDENTIEIQVPAPNEFNLVWDTSQCVISGAPVPGTRRVATPVNVTVTNVSGSCSDTLEGGLVYQPESSDCQLGAVPDQTALTFADTPVGSCSADSPQTIVITNYGSVAVTWTVTTPSGADGPMFTLGGTTGGSLNPGETANLDVSFCPTSATAANDFMQATITITSTDSDPTTAPVSTVVSLAGTALAADLDVTPPGPVDFGSVAADAGGTSCLTQNFTVSNLGEVDMNWSVTSTSPVFTVTPSNGTVAPGGSTAVSVDFCPTAVQSYTNFYLEFTAPDAPTATTTQRVQVSGTGT